MGRNGYKTYNGMDVSSHQGKRAYTNSETL